jgi:hypothetical protein
MRTRRKLSTAERPANAGLPGAEATKPELAGTTTADGTRSSRNRMSDHEVRLPYQGKAIGMSIPGGRGPR